MLVVVCVTVYVCVYDPVGFLGAGGEIQFIQLSSINDHVTSFIHPRFTLNNPSDYSPLNLQSSFSE